MAKANRITRAAAHVEAAIKSALAKSFIPTIPQLVAGDLMHKVIDLPELYLPSEFVQKKSDLIAERKPRFGSSGSTGVLAAR